MEERRLPLSQVPKKKEVSMTLWRSLSCRPACSREDHPPPPQGATDAQLACWKTVSCLEWEVWKFSLYEEVSAFAHHYPGLAEAAVNSANPLLTSISRLLWGRQGTQPEIFSTQTWAPAIGPGLPAVFLLKRSGSHYFGVKQSKPKGSNN